MAKGTLKVFNDVAGWMLLTAGSGVFDWLSSGSWKIALISDGVDTLLVTESDPWFNPQGTGSTNITEVSRTGGYEPIVLATLPDGSTEDTSDDGQIVFRLNTASPSFTDGIVSWDQDDAGPGNIKTAVIYDNNTNFSPSRPCICFIDLTEDGGSTAVSLASSGIDITFGQGGTAGDILNITVSN